MLAIASGTSANRRAISAGVLTCRSAFGRQQPAGGFQGRVISDAGEHIEQLAPPRLVQRDAVGGHQRQPERARQFDQGLVARLLVAVEVALQLDVNVLAAEGANKLFQARAVGPRGQADQAFGELLELLGRRPRLRLFSRADSCA